MIALYILAGVILFLFLLLMTNVRVRVTSSDELKLAVGAGPVSIRLIGKKKKKIRLRGFSQRKYLKKISREKKPAGDKKLSSEKSEKVKTPLRDTVGFIKELLARYEEFTGDLNTEISYLNVNVAGSDASSAAITYGVLSQTVTYLIELLDNKTRLKIRDPKKITVTCDYFAEKTTFSLDVTMKIRVINALKTVVKILLLKLQHNTNINKSNDNEESEDSSNG